MADYIRARSPERKRERMETIMGVADSLFASRPYQEITLSLIAQELGWSRANLYKYVSTKEEIFLELHNLKSLAYFEDLTLSLAEAPMDDGDFARLWAEATGRHGQFLRYQDVVGPIIEANVSYERLARFKRNFACGVRPVVALLRRQCEGKASRGGEEPSSVGAGAGTDVDPAGTDVNPAGTDAGTDVSSAGADASAITVQAVDISALKPAAAESCAQSRAAVFSESDKPYYDLYLQLIFQAPALYNHFNFDEEVRRAIAEAGLPTTVGTFEEDYATFTLMSLQEYKGR